MSALSFFRRLVTAFACSAGVCAVLPAAEVGHSSVPREGLLVLANGRIIEGIIAAEGEYYKVLLPKGKLQVRIDQVEFLCESREEAYVRRRARKIAATATADAHLEMARWCVQNDLLAYAGAEITAARDIDPQHRMLPGAERQLAQARKLFHRDTQTEDIIKDNQVATASFESENPAQAFGEIPPWARTEFIRRIQPMMAQSCATAGCHLPASSETLQIDRLALDGVGNPDLIHRNLASTMALVDLANPEESRLLAMGATAHGREGKQSRPLTPHQLEILRAWITQLALKQAPPESDDQTQITQIVVGMNSGAQQKLISGAAAAVAAPDPFDPAEFNQSSDAPPATEASETTPPAEVAPPEDGATKPTP